MLPDGGLLVSLSTGADDLVHLNAQGQIVQRWNHLLKAHTDSFETDVGLAINPAGNLVLLGKSSLAVFEFGPDGTFLSRFGYLGRVYEFALPPILMPPPGVATPPPGGP